MTPFLNQNVHDNVRPDQTRPDQTRPDQIIPYHTIIAIGPKNVDSVLKSLKFAQTKDSKNDVFLDHLNGFNGARAFIYLTVLSHFYFMQKTFEVGQTSGNAPSSNTF